MRQAKPDTRSPAASKRFNKLLQYQLQPSADFYTNVKNINRDHKSDLATLLQCTSYNLVDNAILYSYIYSSIINSNKITVLAIHEVFDYRQIAMASTPGGVTGLPPNAMVRNCTLLVCRFLSE